MVTRKSHPPNLVSFLDEIVDEVTGGELVKMPMVQTGRGSRNVPGSKDRRRD